MPKFEIRVDAFTFVTVNAKDEDDAETKFWNDEKIRQRAFRQLGNPDSTEIEVGSVEPATYGSNNRKPGILVAFLKRE